MALKTLMLRRSIETKKASLEELRKKDAEFQSREAELEAAINEATTQEEQDAVSAEVDTFEQDKGAHEEAKTTLEQDIKKLEKELADAEEKTPKRSAPPAPKTREEDKKMNTRINFYGMTMQERDAFFADQEIKDFLAQVRTCMREKRALTNVGLTIPQQALGLLKQKIAETSKLIAKVDRRTVSGTGRMRIMGELPEAIWTEACAKLNELDLVFNDVEVDGYKVGGFFAVCNAVLEDNDVNLMSELLNALGKAIGKAIDKAIVYGTGVKMPLGIATRLAQTVKPSNYPVTAREWKNLSTTNVITGTGATGLKLFQEIVGNMGKIINDYSDGGLLWLMNSKTKMKLQVQSMEKNLNATIVAGMTNTMPVAGGEIVELPFIPDENIVFGYFDMYLLAERAGTALGQSEHVRFVEDQTVFKGTARYDGLPLIPEAFGVMSLTTTAPVTSVAFPEDKANTTTGAGTGTE